MQTVTEVLKLKKSNCKNCYKCIRHCPVKSIRFSGNQAHIIGNECILCGKCFVVCPQDAKEIVDETEKVKVMLQSGEPVYVSLAPSFVANYEESSVQDLCEALEKLGFSGVEETAVGATIVKTEYERMLREEKRNVLISSCCHSVNLLIQKYFPQLLPNLADILSPMQAHCVDMKKRYPGAKTVFIGPCVAKKDEAAYYGYADAVLTFEELSAMLAEKGIEIGRSGSATEKRLARFFPTTGGILKTMAKQEGYTYIAIDGTENCIEALRDIEAGKVNHCFVEMSACVGSCIGGPVMEKKNRQVSLVRDYISVASTAGGEDFAVDQPTPEELAKHIEYIPHKASEPNDEEIAEILRKMGKTRPEDELNCGSCGYNTCREKAIAVYQGKAHISMCLPFLKEKAENFSDTIIKNTPNAIVVLNEELEVQQINKAALKIMNISRASDVLGEPVVRILDPKTFLSVRDSGRGIKDCRTYLAEYKRYVEQTILYDRDYHILICLMRDVTDEENERSKKEKISRQTVEIADNVVDKQMRIVQEIASLLGETAAETKIALAKLKESIADE